MLDWFRKTFGRAEAPTSLSPLQVDRLSRLLLKLGPVDARFPERALHFVVQGTDDAILTELAATTGAGRALGLKVCSNGMSGGTGDAELYHPSTESSIYLRLAKLFEAASRRDSPK